MTEDAGLLPGRLLRRPGPPERVERFPGVQIDDPRLAEALRPDAPLLRLYDGTLHGEGTVWSDRDSCLYWSDVPNRRLLRWRSDDGRVTVAIDGTYFMNGNAIDAEGRLVHCEHGRRCVSRSNGDGAVEPIVTHFEGKRLNSPNDIVVAADGAIWFTDPTFELVMPKSRLSGRSGTRPSQRLPVRPRQRSVAPDGRFRTTQRARFLARRPNAVRVGHGPVAQRDSRASDGPHARNPGVRRRRRRRAFQPAVLLPCRPWRPRRFQGRRARVGLDHSRRRRSRHRSRPHAARLHSRPPSVPIVRSAAPQGQGCSSPPRNTCWLSTFSHERRSSGPAGTSARARPHRGGLHVAERQGRHRHRREQRDRDEPFRSRSPRAGAEIAIDYVANPEATEALEREIAASRRPIPIGVDADVGQSRGSAETRGCSRFEIQPHRYHGQQRWRRDPDVDLGYDRG